MAAKKSLKDKLNRSLSTIKSPTFNFGFAKNEYWASTGNYALNWYLSNSFDKGYCFGRSVLIGGEPGSGKSLHTAYVCAEAQKNLNTLVVWVDVEKASSEEWLAKCGVDTENVIFQRAGTVDDIKEVIASTCKEIRDHTISYAKGEDTEPPQPLILVIDSYSASMTEAEYEKAVKGEKTPDQGQQAKQIGSLVKQATHLTDGLPILIIGMVHIYYNQDMYAEKEKLSGGIKALFMASYGIKLNKKKLTAEDMGLVKSSAKNEEKRKVLGISSVFKIEKSRFSKPFETVEVDIPYSTGMDKYSGLFKLFTEIGIVYVPKNDKGGSSTGWWTYTLPDGTKAKNFRESDFVTGGHADILMGFVNYDTPIGVNNAPEDVEIDDSEELE